MPPRLFLTLLAFLALSLPWTTPAATPPDTAGPTLATIDEAIARGDVGEVRKHLAADPARARSGKSPTQAPLHQAILRRKTEIALLLLAAGADPDAPDASGRTPLHLAVERDERTVLDALLRAGADPARLDRVGWPPLHHAAAKNRLELARALLAGGADPNAVSACGGTALHEAAASGGPDLVSLLLAAGCDPRKAAATGDTPLSIAERRRDEPVLAALHGTSPAE